MRKIGILDSGPRDNYGLLRTVEELKKKNAEVFVFEPTNVSIIVNNETLEIKHKEIDLLKTIDVCLIRRTRGAVSESIEIIYLLTQNNVKCVDSIKAFTSPLSKTVTMSNASKSIPIPETIILNSDILIDQIDWHTFPAIVKPLNGFKGEGVSLVKNIDQLIRNTKELFHSKERVIIQRYLKIVNEFRVTVVGDQVICVCMKKTSDSDPLSRNFTQGAKMQICDNPQLHPTALKIASLNNVIIAGVDLAETEEGVFLLECNRCPGFEGVESCGINVAEKICDLLLNI
jgi:RimK family alpha-L-glutamate ligase